MARLHPPCQRHVVRLAKGISRTAAGELAQVQRAAILKAEAGIGGPKLKDPAFDGAVKEFTAWADTNRKARTARDYREILERLKAVFGGRRLRQIDELSIERHKRTRAAGGAPVAVNRELAVRKSLFNRCRDDLRIYDGPTPRMRLLKESRGRLRFLDVEEEAALLKAAGEPLRTIILVGIHTRLRIKSEALALQTVDVDLARGLLTVPAAYAKNGRSRTVPLNSTIRAALARSLESRANGPLFVRPNGKSYRSIRKASALPVRPSGSRISPRTPCATPSQVVSRWPVSIRGRSRSWAGGGRLRWWSGTATWRRATWPPPSNGSLPRNSPTLFRKRPGRRAIRVLADVP